MIRRLTSKVGMFFKAGVYLALACSGSVVAQDCTHNDITLNSQEEVDNLQAGYLDIETTRGGVFDSSEPMPEQNPDGTITIDFRSCNTGMIT